MPTLRNENWGIVTGCERLTHGCDSCPSYLEYKSNDWNYNPKFNQEQLEAPLKNATPTRYSVALGSDLFHEAVTPEQLVSVFEVMKKCTRHYFEIITKRAERCTYISKDLALHYGGNIALLYVVEDERSKWRIEYLRETEAKLKALSIVPLLGSMGAMDLDGIAFVGVQPETWGEKRECKKKWIDDIESQCKEQGVVFSLGEVDTYTAINGEVTWQE